MTADQAIAGPGGGRLIAGARAPGRFLGLNLIGFPLFGLLSWGIVALLGTVGTPWWIGVVAALGIGLGLIGANFYLLVAAQRASGWTRVTVAMAIWSFACVLSLILLSSYSPLNAALWHLARAV